MGWNKKYDIVVVGGGHAGLEASMACARSGLHTALITMNVDMIGHMPCNPAVGGLGKSQIVREIDALGGWIGRLADSTGIQFRMLNKKKGPAVWSLRTQNDKILYRQKSQSLVFNQDHLDVIQEEVVGLVITGDRCTGVKTLFDEKINAQAVIITPGTFLGGTIFVGLNTQSAGRLGEFNSSMLSQSLSDAGLKIARLKTGTPCRIDKRTIDWNTLEPQPGDTQFPFFSHWESPRRLLPQIDCHLTYTNEKTHEIIRGALDRSPLYTGRITGIGPRYCPSIEDKVTRFPDRDHHDVSGTDSPFRETANIRDGSNKTADMAVHNVIGDAMRGATWVSLHNGGGVGWGEVINGGFGILLDGSEMADRRITSMIDWDVNNGIARRAWARNPGALHAISRAMQRNPNLHVTLPNLTKESTVQKAVNLGFENNRSKS